MLCCARDADPAIRACPRVMPHSVREHLMPAAVCRKVAHKLRKWCMATPTETRQGGAGKV